MLRSVPMDKKGNIRYPDFLAQFDAGRDNKSLFAPSEFTSARIRHNFKSYPGGLSLLRPVVVKSIFYLTVNLHGLFYLVIVFA